MALHDLPSNAARVAAMLDTGLVLALVLHLPGHWVAFRQQSSGAFVYLDSLKQRLYPETAMRAAPQLPPTLGSSNAVVAKLLELLGGPSGGGAGEQCYFLFRLGSRAVVKAASIAAGRLAAPCRPQTVLGATPEAAPEN